MALFAIKTTASHEQTVAEMVANRGLEGIHASLAPEQMVSYVIVEADELGDVERAVEEVPHARKVLPQKTSISEVEQFLEPASDVKGITEGSVVELTGGPFQGDKAKVDKVDEANERVTVTLYENTVPIPVEVRGDQMRVLDKDEED